MASSNPHITPGLQARLLSHSNLGRIASSTTEVTPVPKAKYAPGCSGHTLTGAIVPSQSSDVVEGGRMASSTHSVQPQAQLQHVLQVCREMGSPYSHITDMLQARKNRGRLKVSTPGQRQVFHCYIFLRAAPYHSTPADTAFYHLNQHHHKHHHKQYNHD